MSGDERMSDNDTTAENRTDQLCACCDTATGAEGTTDRPSERWLGATDPLAAELPDDLREALGRLLGEGPVDSIGEWVEQIRRRTGGGTIDIDDLCHADGETPHRGTLDGETYHFLCFYDAVVLAALSDDTVDIRTESPDGKIIEARATGTEVSSVSPREAVFSFGVDASVVPPADGTPTHTDVYAAVCPYVRAFPGWAAYERWAGSVDAATVAMPLQDGTGLATALVE